MSNKSQNLNFNYIRQHPNEQRTPNECLALRLLLKMAYHEKCNIVHNAGIYGFFVQNFKHFAAKYFEVQCIMLKKSGVLLSAKLYLGDWQCHGHSTSTLHAR